MNSEQQRRTAEYIQQETRRYFLGRGGNVLGWAALQSLLGAAAVGGATALGRTPVAFDGDVSDANSPIGPHFAPRAKRVIYLHMVGWP